MIMEKIQGNCGDRNFGFYWKEYQRTDDNYFVIGDFQIIINNRELLKKIPIEIEDNVPLSTERTTVKTKDGEVLNFISNPSIGCPSNYINFIIHGFKENIVKIKENKITCSNEDKNTLYLNACYYRKYWTYIENEEYENFVENLEWDDPKIDEIFEKIDNKLNKHELNSSFGLELEVYPVISDQGWQFFLFQNQDKTKDRLIYSNDWGKTVHEVQLELGTVERVLSELPDL